MGLDNVDHKGVVYEYETDRGELLEEVVTVELVADGEGFAYLRGARPRYANEWMEEAVLRLEAGERELMTLCLRMVEVQCEINRDWAFRNKAAR